MILHQQIEALEQEAHALEANETLLQDKEDAIMRRCLSITHHLLQHTKRVLAPYTKNTFYFNFYFASS